MKKKTAGFPVPTDIKVAQKGSVLITNARPMGNPVTGYDSNGLTEVPIGPQGRVTPGRREFLHGSTTDGRGRTYDE